MRHLIRAFSWFWLLGGLFLLGACRESPDVTSPAARAEAARQAWLANDFPAAETAYQDYLQRFPDGLDRVEAWKRLADIAFAVKGQPGPAVTLLETALLEKRLTATQFFDLADTAMDTALLARQYAKVIGFGGLMLERPDVPPALLPTISLRREQAFLALGSPTEALATLRQCRQHLGDAARAAPCTLALGLLLAKDDIKEAVPLFLALYDDPNVASTLRARAGFALGEAAETDHDPARARYWYEAIKDSFPNPKVVRKKLDLLKK